MTATVVIGDGQRRPRRTPSPVEVMGYREFVAAPAAPDQVLVVGSTADVAAIAAAVPVATAIAFATAAELSRLFAVDPSFGAAWDRLHTGQRYEVDLGMLSLGGAERPFLGTVVAGAGAGGGAGFPWAGAAASITVAVPGRQPRERDARAVTVSNLQHWGRWTLSPRSAPNDSLFEIQTFSGATLDLVRLRRRLPAGLHGRDPGVRQIRTAAAVVAVPDSWGVTADRLRVGYGSFAVRLLPGRTTLLI